jgi:acyl-CoA thioester hydrolase
VVDEPLRAVEFRVSMGDTDAAQVIYFGAPVPWAERLVTGYLADIGLPTSDLLADGYGLPAVELSVKYRSPLRLDDRVRGELRVQTSSARSVTWECTFSRADQTVPAVRVVLTQVAVEVRDGQPAAVALPTRLRAHLTAG